MTMQTLAVLLAFAISLQQPPQGGAQQEASAPATIMGRVVDKASGAPIPRALVIVRSFGPGRSVQKLTGTDGDFRITNLGPGTYDVSVMPGEFSAAYVPNRFAPGGPLRLKPGETREMEIALERARTISGRVVDEAGLPLSGVRLRVRDLSTGAEHYGFRPGSGQTDDLGTFRLFGLPSGRYIVCADGNAGPHFGPAVGARPIRFVRTCHPTSSDEGSAQAVIVQGADVEGIEIRMQRAPTYSVSGIVLNSSGGPAETYLLGWNRIERNGSSGTARELRASQFTLSNVVPGQYELSAVMNAEGSSGSAPQEAARLLLEITNENVSGLVLTMKKPVSLRGAVTFEDGPPATIRSERLRVLPMRSGPGGGGSWARDVQVNADWSFELEQLFGSVVLTLSGLPAGLAVKSILYRGRDILDVPTEFDGDPRHGVEMVVTGRVAELSGRVFDDRGNPAGRSVVYLFPVEASRWDRWMQAGGRSSDTGAFRLRSLVPGDYMVVAISEQDDKEIVGTEWYRPNPYERLAKIAERVSLLENDRRVMDLRVTPIPQEWKR